MGGKSVKIVLPPLWKRGLLEKEKKKKKKNNALSLL